jgi:hypothetical protein
MKDAWNRQLEEYFQSAELAFEPYAAEHDVQQIRPIPWQFFSEARELTSDILFGSGRPTTLFDNLIDRDALFQHMQKSDALTGAGISTQIPTIFGLQMYMANEIDIVRDGEPCAPIVIADGTVLDWSRSIGSTSL